MKNSFDKHNFPDSKVHGANMGPNWGRQDQGGPHVGPMNFAIRVSGPYFGTQPLYYDLDRISYGSDIF